MSSSSCLLVNECLNLFHGDDEQHVYKIPIGLVSMGYDPMNQTTCVGNFPQDSNPTQFL
jgi:hypothetical protein